MAKLHHFALGRSDRSTCSKIENIKTSVMKSIPKWGQGKNSASRIMDGYGNYHPHFAKSLTAVWKHNGDDTGSTKLAFYGFFQSRHSSRRHRAWRYCHLIQRSLRVSYALPQHDDVRTEAPAHATHNDVQPKLELSRNGYFCFQRIGNQFCHVFAIHLVRYPSWPISHECTQLGQV